MSNDTAHLIKILYCIKLSSARNLSFPNQYDLRIVAASNIFRKISKLQKDYAEIFCDKEQAIRNRMIGIFDGYEVCFIESFDELKSRPNALKVLFSDTPPNADDTDARTIVIVTDTSLPKADGYLHLEDLTPNFLKKRAVDLVSSLSEEEQATLGELRELVGFESEYSDLEAATEIPDGFYNRINIAVLESLRIKVRRNGVSSTFNTRDTEALVNRIIQVRSHIVDTMGVAGVAPAVQMYFSDTSSSLEFYRNRKNYTEVSLRNRGADAKALVEAIKFSDRGLVSDNNPKNAFIAQLEHERLLLDDLIVLNAANNVAPVVKLPLSNNKAFSQVVNLAASDRGDRRKTNALMKQVRDAFSKYLDNWLEYADNSPSLAIKLVSNLPLEWTHHQGLPLMVRHEVSRIPVTPGYVISELLLDSKVVHLSPRSFREVLFISSFADDDPIRDDLKHKLRAIEQNLHRNFPAMVEQLKGRGAIPSDFALSDKLDRLGIRFKWIEVATGDELIEAINANPCAMTVFDLHGSHGIDGGLIHLKEETIYASSLLGKVRISPLVVLSSCDTSPVDKGHDSTVEAFLLAGAKTVISSALPIESDLASTFLARLLIRIQTYLPIALRHRPSIRWSTLVSGMIRRAYYHELVTLLQKKHKFDSEIKTDLLFRIGTKLDPLHRDWVNAVSREITSMLGISADYLNEFVAKNVQFVECMKYFQFGKPELVVLSPDDEY
ncbi:CHAT domain-containing protein [Burkholderia gladioli]|uniref:CHAT domain-containing protein n=1 Tax=Burkholderia gladioli (strain BSR3) TaxID=999541 RepID=F2LS18_BURGS|nr:CHAT domain-containing protein [Burkholderia gladioli]AEA65677.1 hypothetical protein bgla_2p0830 [Burkholderia gladioli BSR3]